MSSISLLSKSYREIAAISDRLNEAVVLLKKHYLLGFKKAELSDEMAEDLNITADDAASFVSSVIREVLLAKKDRHHELEILPDSIKDVVEKKLDYFLQDELLEVANKLDIGEQLGEKDFKMIEKIQGLIDTDRGKIFRKLRSRRL